MTNTIRAHHVADAYCAVARANHYMVGIVATDITYEELEAAEQILIDKQNALPQQKGQTFLTLDLALDLIEMAKRERGSLYDARKYAVEETSFPFRADRGYPECNPGDDGSSD